MAYNRNKTVCKGCGAPMRRPRNFVGPDEEVRCKACRDKRDQFYQELNADTSERGRRFLNH